MRTTTSLLAPLLVAGAVLCAPALLAGCEAAPARPEPGPDHPASPRAPEGPEPRLEGEATATSGSPGAEEGGAR